MLGLIGLFNSQTTGKAALAEASQETFDARMEALILDEVATVSEAIHPHQSGRVFFEGTYWFARCPFEVTILPDVPVIVRDRYNLTLFVEPLLSSTQN